MTRQDRADRILAIKLLLLAILLVACLIWLLTHTACNHPIENGLASLTAFILIPLMAMNAIEHTPQTSAPHPSKHCRGAAATRTVENTNQ